MLSLYPFLIAFAPLFQAGKAGWLRTQIELASWQLPFAVKHYSTIHAEKIQQVYLVNLFFAHHTGADGLVTGFAASIRH